jgi:hypothetical protein
MCVKLTLIGLAVSVCLSVRIIKRKYCLTDLDEISYRRNAIVVYNKIGISDFL